MIVCFFNIKGGVGKSKLNSFFSGFLAHKEKTVAFLDTDVNQKTSSVYRSVENPFLTHIDYKVENGNVAEYVLELAKDFDFVVVDMPGTLQQEGVVDALSVMDYIIVPSTAAEEDLHASSIFVDFLEELNVPHKVLMNNYEVQFFGMNDHEKDGFSEFSNYFKCGVFELGIRKNRSLLQENFVFGEYGEHHKTNTVEPTLELILKTIEDHVN